MVFESHENVFANNDIFLVALVLCFLLKAHNQAYMLINHPNKPIGRQPIGV